jgi:hypothetical protein
LEIKLENESNGIGYVMLVKEAERLLCYCGLVENGGEYFDIFGKNYEWT